ncbi:MAG TPA: SIS domain-containing protein [Anaerolineae bacterium]|nr:SIS domain-containing protein [Anaerolineae bacterium]
MDKKDYHMLKYIHEGPGALQETLQANDSAVREIGKEFRKREIERILITGLGSSYTAAVMAKPLFDISLDKPIMIINSEETAYFQEQWVNEKSLIVAVSRSGERESVVGIIKAANRLGALGVAVTGVANSLLAHNSDLTLLTQEGPEITFPKTKSVLAGAGLLMRLGLELANVSNPLTQKRMAELERLPEIITRTIAQIDPEVKGLMSWVKDQKYLNVVGTCSNYGVALEAAVKVQESAYIPTRGNSTAGLLQGPIGALNEDWLVYTLVMQEDYELSTSLIELAHKFGAKSICIQPPNLPTIPKSKATIKIAEQVDPFLAALVYLPAVQLLAYNWTITRGLNPDVPESMRQILDAILPPGREEPELRK